MRTFSSLLLLLVVAANVVAYIHAGFPGVASWWRAKLVGGVR